MCSTACPRAADTSAGLSPEAFRSEAAAWRRLYAVTVWGWSLNARAAAASMASDRARSGTVLLRPSNDTTSRPSEGTSLASMATIGAAPSRRHRSTRSG